MAEDDESVAGGYLTPTRGWRVYGPSSRTMAKMMRQETHSQLLQKAASLTPDYGKVIEGIQKYKVDPVTAKWFENEANSKMQGYVNKFQENPFYAFSREGRETVSSLQRLANDPRLQYAESAYDMSKKEYEKHDEELQTINYNDGTVMVYDNETGKAKRMSAFNIDPTKHIPLNGEQEFQFLTRANGFKDGASPFKVTVSKVSEMRSRLHTEFNDSGYVKIKDELKDMATKTNQPQIKSKFESLVKNINLSDQDRNTINGQYVAYAIANGQKPTAQGAREYMIKYLADIADYKTYSETEVGLDSSGSGGVGGVGGKGAVAPVGRYEAAASAPEDNGAPMQGTAYDPTTKQQQTFGGYTAPNFFNYQDNGLEFGKLPLNVNPVFRAFAEDNSNLIDMKGNPLNKSRVIPYGENVYFVDLPNGRRVMVFDAFVHEGASSLRPSGVPINDDDQNTLAGILEYIESKSDESPDFRVPDVGTDWWIDGTDWYKTKVQIEVSPSAGNQARTFLDKNPKYINRAAENVATGGAPLNNYPTR